MEPLYDDMFRRLEKVRWQLGDIPFHEVARDRVSHETLAFLRVNCLIELSSLYATRMFLRDFRELTDFCQFTSIWYYEEMKHYLVLREYLKVFDLAPDPEALPDLDLELAPKPWPGTLAMHYCGELRLGMWYHAWSESAEEPVLATIYELIGNDEFRHAGCYKAFMERAIEHDPSRLLAFAQAAKWMLFNPDGDKHPTTMKSDAAGEESVTDRIDGYEVLHERVKALAATDLEERLGERVFRTFSRLGGCNVSSLAEFAAFTRELARESRSGPGSGSPAPRAESPPAA